MGEGEEKTTIRNNERIFEKKRNGFKKQNDICVLQDVLFGIKINLQLG
jgi:hypothetical protein